jgi:hypothetical protein
MALGKSFMKMANIAFGITDWSEIEGTEHKGEKGIACRPF